MTYDTISFIGLTYRPGTKSPHLVTKRINHRYSFLFSHRKTYFSPEETSRYLICIIPDEIQDFLWLLKYWGRGSFRERHSLRVWKKKKKKLGCSWYIRRGSARGRHIKRQYQSWRLNPSVKVTLPMAPISASTGGRIAWHCPVTSTQKHGALERVSQLSTPHFNSL